MPRALTSAHPQSSVTSPPQVTPPRQSHPHRSPQLSRARGRSPHTLAPPASSGRPSRTNRDSAQPVGVPKRCAVVQVSLFPHRRRGPHTGPDRSTPSATCLSLHSASDRGMHTLRPPAASARDAPLSHAHARPRNRSGPPFKSANDPSLRQGMRMGFESPARLTILSPQ